MDFEIKESWILGSNPFIEYLMRTEPIYRKSALNEFGGLMFVEY